MYLWGNLHRALISKIWWSGIYGEKKDTNFTTEFTLEKKGYEFYDEFYHEFSSAGMMFETHCETDFPLLSRSNHADVLYFVCNYRGARCAPT